MLTLTLQALEPISIGLESTGIKMLLYRIPIITPSGEVLEVPVIPGNSLRGVLRDAMAIQFLLDVQRQQTNTSVHAGTAVSLFSGGILARGEEAGVNASDLDRLMNEYVRYLLPISILGASVSKIMIPSKIKVGMGYPVTHETSFLVNHLSNITPTHSLEDILVSVLMTRKDDRAKFGQLADLGIQLSGLDVFLEKAGGEREVVVQQRFEREAVAPGTRFVTYIRELLPLADAEKGLLLKTLDQLSSVGGRIAGGLGEFRLIRVDGVTGADKNKAQHAYDEFIRSKGQEIAEALKKNPQEV
ncbi:MAG: hypothetical protein QW376_08585 [Candidatus Caldarchaeum sp.]